MNNTENYNQQMYAQQAYQQSLTLIAEAVQGEKEDQVFYDYLISLAPNQEQIEIITSIRNDEIKHNQWFREMYKALTGNDVVVTTEEQLVSPANYEAGIKKAFFGELKAMEKYRVIRAGLPYREYRDIVFEILTDEMKHAQLYNYILTENISKNVPESMQENTSANTSWNKPEPVGFPDQWIQYTQYLVNEALSDVERGVNLKHILQEFILMGVLVGKGYTPEQAYETVENWELSGESQLLYQSKNIK
ncbi:ferritin-like domain-containing protein [Psychrobacillus sp. FSL K6-2684]|uniref:ferritin-like domain-containing protein n=1 Tax=unclassified Psychrobacillus TaxID=2636677 RepID=UPI001243F0C6|nr:ferritin-like domain-containing protein [Psychrobacillus sp. AK 1817]QEY21806.1 ferritin-like domain-containing protein [Psychrobacillus sp. AK 1817]